jgi:uncharacterized membrane protein (UPF0127 family)
LLLPLRDEAGFFPAFSFSSMRTVIFLALACIAAAARAELPAVQLAVGMYLIRAEVADSMGTRMEGLMHRKSMPQGAGMVFVFDETATHCMWMKNTLIPLSVAFIDEGGKITNIADMQPQTEESHCAARPARYALEMNKGWFTQRGIKAGASLRGLEKLAPR